MIERIQFVTPWTMDTTKPHYPQLQQAIRVQPLIHEVLGEGRYDLTPTAWSSHEHTLVVFANGKGLYGVTPRDGGNGSLIHWEHQGSIEEIQAEQQFRFPEDGSVQIIATMTTDGSKIEVYDVIQHKANLQTGLKRCVVRDRNARSILHTY